MNRRQLDLVALSREMQLARALQGERLDEVVAAFADLLLQVVLDDEEQEEVSDECDR